MAKDFKPDVVLKKYWNNKEHYADFFNAVLFNGRDIINAALTVEEYLSHMRKEDKFIPIVTVVIYYSDHPWDGVRDLHGVLNIPEQIKPFVGNYPMQLPCSF